MSDGRRIRRRVLRTLPLLAALTALLTALVLISDVERDSVAASRHYIWVLGLTGLALLTLVLTISHRLVTLVRRVRAGAPGARLSARWVRHFVLLSLPPALIVYGFAVYFMTRTVDSWFDVEIETALADSLALGQQFLDLRTLEARNRMLGMRDDLAAMDDDLETQRRALARRVSSSGPVELSLLTADGRVLATAAADPLADLGQRPDDYALVQAIERGEYAAAEPVGEDQLRIRIITRLDPTVPRARTRYLQAIYPLPSDFVAMAGNIEREYHGYQNLAYLRGALKSSFLLILTLVLMLTVLLAILAALNTARRQVDPLSRLARAVQRVADGDLDHTVDVPSRDELGFLARSFNEMTRALTTASETVAMRTEELRAQGEYLETVLGSLSSGVLTLTGDGTLDTTNAAAREILNLTDDEIQGLRPDDIARKRTDLEPLMVLLERHRDRSQWQQELHLDAARPPIVLLVRGSRLSGEDRAQVVVFDDVTVLNEVQREAAWSEAAQRMAHEVKNPLTPIRLAAERLRMKLTDRLDPAGAEVLDRSASTIIAQVEALKTLVDAFGDYAREPDLKREPLDVDQLIDDVAALYRGTHPDLRLELDLGGGASGVTADAGRIRQLLHNLIRNAAESGGDSGVTVHLGTRTIDDTSGSWVELVVADNGPGFPPAVLERPFQPHVSHRPGGKGLGLAICRKIVIEHDGRISLENRDSGGARVCVRLPRRSAATRPAAGGA